MNQITQRRINILQKVAYYASKKLRVEQDLLEAYLIDKLPRLQKNFVPDLGRPFEAYLTISLRFYCLNYLRDKSWTVKVTSSELKLYSKINKWKSIRVTSRRLGVSEERLREIKHKVLSNMANFSTSFDSVSYMFTETKTNDNPYVNFVSMLGGEKAVKSMNKDKLKQLWEEYNS